jgi:hypothetical protein
MDEFTSGTKGIVTTRIIDKLVPCGGADSQSKSFPARPIDEPTADRNNARLPRLAAAHMYKF